MPYDKTFPSQVCLTEAGLAGLNKARIANKKAPYTKTELDAFGESLLKDRIALDVGRHGALNGDPAPTVYEYDTAAQVHRWSSQVVFHFEGMGAQEKHDLAQAEALQAKEALDKALPPKDAA